MNRLHYLLILLIFPMLCEGRDFIDKGKADKFLETDVHFLIGGSYVTNNYASEFPEIADVNASMRGAWGIGLGGRFNFNNFVGIGTELNLTFNHSRMDMAVQSVGTTTASSVFLNNSYRYMDVPVFIRFNFNLAGTVRWNVDSGFYYAYGTGGKQKSTIITSTINGLGQLITVTERSKCNYFNNSSTFINTNRRNDWGLHLATGLTFSRKISVGVRMHYGLKNIAGEEGIIRPSCHNLNVMASLGYIF